MANISLTVNHLGTFSPEDNVSSSLFTVIGRSVSYFVNEIKSLLLRHPGSSIYLQVVVWPLETPNEICPNSRSVTLDFSFSPPDTPGAPLANFYSGGFYERIRKAA